MKPPTDTRIINAIRDVQATGLASTEALTVDYAAIALSGDAEPSDAMRRAVQRVWDRRVKVWAGA